MDSARNLVPGDFPLIWSSVGGGEGGGVGIQFLLSP